MSRGRVFTFYSYKGGVGRTMALANVAALLSEWGHNVLCIDWDLEAPGLDRYLLGRSGRTTTDGLVDYVTAFAHGDSPDWRAFVTSVDLESGARLDLIHAGREDVEFLGRMQAIDWEELYAEHGLGDTLETTRDEWINTYDFVLIDSRTGINDVSGICTVHLPDEMVVLFTANSQSFDGVLRVIDLAERQRNHLPVDRPRMLILPLISRFELRVQYEEAIEWLDEFDERLRPHLERWVEPDAVAETLGLLRIPYVPYWSFGERLAVVTRGTHDADDIGHTYESMAALMANGFAEVAGLRHDREAFVTRAAKHSPRDTRYDILIIGDPADSDYVQYLEEEFGQRGISVDTWLDMSSDPVHDSLRDPFELASNYLFVLSSRWHPRRESSVRRAIECQASSGQPRRIVPLMVDDSSSSDLPRSLRSLATLRSTGSVDADVSSVVSLLDLKAQAGQETRPDSSSRGWLELDEAFETIFEQFSHSAAQISHELLSLNQRVSSDSERMKSLMEHSSQPDHPMPQAHARRRLKRIMNDLGTFLRVRARRLMDQRVKMDRLLESQLAGLLIEANQLGFLSRHPPTNESMSNLQRIIPSALESIHGLMESMGSVPLLTGGFKSGQAMLMGEFEKLASHFQRLDQVLAGALREASAP